MKTYAFHIQKGGVGKTTLSGNVSYALSKKGKTLLIDADPQGNTTMWLAGHKANEIKYDLAYILNGEISPKEAIIQLNKNFYLIPTFSIGGKLKNYGETKLFQEPFIFEDLKNTFKTDFDYLIYDLSPGISMLERSILLSCDEVITPLTPEFFGLDGIEIFNGELEKINKNYRKKICHTKIVINMKNESFKTHKETLKKMKELDYTLFEISQDRKLADSQFHNKTIFEYFPSSKTVSQIKTLAKALEI